MTPIDLPLCHSLERTSPRRIVSRGGNPVRVRAMLDSGFRRNDGGQLSKDGLGWIIQSMKMNSFKLKRAKHSWMSPLATAGSSEAISDGESPFCFARA